MGQFGDSRCKVMSEKAIREKEREREKDRQTDRQIEKERGGGGEIGW